MEFQITVVSGPDQGHVFELVRHQPLIIGRDATGAAGLRDPKASRRHCEVVHDGAVCVLRDSASSNGTWVDGQRITRCELAPQQTFRIGGSDLRLEPIDKQTEQTRTMLAEKTARTASTMETLTGSRLGRYTVGSLIARGRSGCLFRARDRDADQEVCLRVMDPQLVADERQRKRFIRAVKTVMPIRHANLVRILGAGKYHDHVFFAMQLIEGENMAEVIRRQGLADRLDWRYAFTVAVQLARALEALHGQDVVHRNLAPRHILVRRRDGRVKLADLMLAKALCGQMAINLSAPGELVGELAYMSPEQTAGPDHMDIRSDIYSLGSVLYALTTGKPPFEAPSQLDIIHAIRMKNPMPIKNFQIGINEHFTGCVEKMMAKNPDHRHQTPTELLMSLERVGRLTGLAIGDA